MKKLMLGLVAALFASNALAVATFDFGTMWWFPKYDNSPNSAPVISPANLHGQGQTFDAAWDLGGDFAIGAHYETVDMSDGQGTTYAFTSQSIVITKGVVKNADIGLRFGTFHDNFNWWPVGGFSGQVTDVIGNVTLMSGTADKVSGSLKANFGARWAQESEYANNWTPAVNYNGYILGLSVGVGI